MEDSSPIMRSMIEIERSLRGIWAARWAQVRSNLGAKLSLKTLGNFVGASWSVNSVFKNIVGDQMSDFTAATRMSRSWLRHCTLSLR